MPRITSPIDGAQLFYYDYIPASVPTSFNAKSANAISPPSVTLVFIHGWPMSSAMFEPLMLCLYEDYHLRCIAIDRRGFGKSDWSARDGVEDVTFDVFADDTIHILEALNIEKFVFVAASMGCAETLVAYGKNALVRNNCKVRIDDAQTNFHIRHDLPPIEGIRLDGSTAPLPASDLVKSCGTASRAMGFNSCRTAQSRAFIVLTSLPGVFGA